MVTAVRIWWLALAVSALAGCNASAPGWTSESEAAFRRDFCGAVLKIDTASQGCDCVMAATKKHFKSYHELSDTKAPPASYTSDIAACGVTLGG
jgi:hypothetical protein